jgi:hypothetical protein
MAWPRRCDGNRRWKRSVGKLIESERSSQEGLDEQSGCAACAEPGRTGRVGRTSERVLSLLSPEVESQTTDFLGHETALKAVAASIGTTAL